MRYSLTIPFIASKGRPRAGSGRVYTPSRTRQAENDIAKLWIASFGGRVLFEGPISCTLSAYLQAPNRLKGVTALGPAVAKPDIDNMLKLVDALSGIAFNDDKQITTVRASKRWTQDEPYMILVLEDDAWP